MEKLNAQILEIGSRLTKPIEARRKQAEEERNSLKEKQVKLLSQNKTSDKFVYSYHTVMYMYSYYTSISYSYIIRVLLLYLSFIASTIVLIILSTLYITVAIHFVKLYVQYTVHVQYY